MEDLKNFVKGHGRSGSSASARDVGPPKDAKFLIPRIRTDDDGQPIPRTTRNLSQDDLSAGLEHISRYLARHGRKIEVIAVGGSVSVMRLLTRKTTHDINIICSPGLDDDSRKLLDNAAHEAQKKHTGLGTHWFNSEAEMWVSGPELQELFRMAEEQNVTLYQGSGLVVYSAPWEYAFIAKLHRMQKQLDGGEMICPCDLEDAVNYLHQFMRGRPRQPVPISKIQEWAKHWRRFQVKDSLLAEVKNLYKHWFGQDIIKP